MANIYVGTYAKYNDGNLFGQWIDPNDYSNKDAFIEACNELHADETDPELMFQDWEDIPDRFIGESSVSEELWDWLDLDEDDRELLQVFADNQWSGMEPPTIDDAREAFDGKFDSPEDWAEDYMESTGGLSEMPENLRSYFDFKAFARDCKLDGGMSFVEHSGHVWAFRNN